MTMKTDRRRQVFAALAAGAILLVTGVSVTFFKTGESGLQMPPATLTPRLLDAPETVAEISVETAGEAFHLRRALEGWVLASHDNYEADAERAAALIEALSRLQPVGERTRLAGRHEQLSLGDPSEGGSGVRVILQDNNERVLADLVIGERSPDGRIYVRQGGEGQSWLANGFLPDFASASDWMQLEFLSLGRESIREACVRPEEGTAYCLQRRTLPPETFEPVSPRGWTLISPGAGDGVATVLGRIRFRDVRPSRQVRGPVLAEHRVTTSNGLEVTLSVRASDGQYWANIVAIAHEDTARPDAVRLNERSDGFAFALSDLSIERMIRPLEEFAVADRAADTP